MRAKDRQVLQRLHPTPYLKEGSIEGTFPIQIAPPAWGSPPAPFLLRDLKKSAQRLASFVVEEGEWVCRKVDTIPYDRIVDRDAVMIAIGELWLTKVAESPDAAPHVNARTEGVPYLTAHPAKTALMSYGAKPIKVSVNWPNHAGHKVFLDRVRKLSRGGLLSLQHGPHEILSNDPVFNYGISYLCSPTELGLVRLLHLVDRLSSRPPTIRRLRVLLKKVGVI